MVYRGKFFGVDAVIDDKYRLVLGKDGTTQKLSKIGHSGDFGFIPPLSEDMLFRDVFLSNYDPNRSIREIITKGEIRLEGDVSSLFGDVSYGDFLGEFVNVAFGRVRKMDLRGFNTVDANNMSNMFQGCEDLAELDLSSFNTLNVGNMSGMFSNCGSLKRLDLSNFNTSNVFAMSQMFMGCRSFKELDLSSFDTSNVTSMRQMFFGCHKLENLDLSYFDTSSVKDVSSMFDCCFHLEGVDLFSWNTENLVNMGSMFCACSNLEKLDLSKFNTSNVVWMDSMFENCSSLKEINLRSFSSEQLFSALSMFSFCHSLEKLDISNFDVDVKKVKIDNMFRQCNGLLEVKMPKNLEFRKMLPLGVGIMFSKDKSDWKSFRHISKNNVLDLDSSLIGFKEIRLFDGNEPVYMLASEDNIKTSDYNEKVDVVFDASVDEVLIRTGFDTSYKEVSVDELLNIHHKNLEDVKKYNQENRLAGVFEREEESEEEDDFWANLPF